MDHFCISWPHILKMLTMFSSQYYYSIHYCVLMSQSSQVRLTRIGSRTALLPRDSQVKPPAARDLVYLAPSPDFCRLDPENGIPGTAGRRCNGKIPRTTSQENNSHNPTYHSHQFRKWRCNVLNQPPSPQEHLGWHQMVASWCVAGQATKQAELRWCSAAPASFPGAARCVASSARIRSPFIPVECKKS